MTLDPPGAKIGAWVPGTTTATKDEVGGKPFGHGFLRPSFQFGATYGDNYFSRSTVGRNLAVFNVAPRPEYQLPGETRALRVASEGRVRRLSNGHWAVGNVLDLDGRIDLTAYLSLAVRDHFIRSPLDSREYDPACFGGALLGGGRAARDQREQQAERRSPARTKQPCRISREPCLHDRVSLDHAPP